MSRGEAQERDALELLAEYLEKRAAYLELQAGLVAAPHVASDSLEEYSEYFKLELESSRVVRQTREALHQFDPIQLRAQAAANAELRARAERAEGELAKLRDALGDRFVIFDDWEMTCGGAPVQYEGKDRLTGRHMFFRERHGWWRIDIDNGGDEMETIGDGEGGEFDTSEETLRERLASVGIGLGEERSEPVPGTTQ